MNQNIVDDPPQTNFVTPSQSTADFVWRMIIIGITVVLITSFLAIAIAIFLKTDAGLIQVLLTVFMATMTFIGGLLIKSPIQQQ